MSVGWALVVAAGGGGIDGVGMGIVCTGGVACVTIGGGGTALELIMADGSGGVKIDIPPCPGAGIDAGPVPWAISTSFSRKLDLSSACFFSFLFSSWESSIFPANPTSPLSPLAPSPFPPFSPSSLLLKFAGRGNPSTTRSAVLFASAKSSNLVATSCFHPIGLLTTLAFALHTIPLIAFVTPALANVQQLASLSLPPILPRLSPSPATRINRTPRNPVPQLGPRNGKVFLNSRWSKGMGRDSSDRMTVNRTRTREMWCKVDQKTPRKEVGMSVDG